ncbi:PREDICTED: uncharacterized protein LOC106546851 [Thamnophis sirtalis]|uniref:Uncharacterized protein LOC106546851 n=1 Tax=Thamnophis sirtalis TaxID=35019 RepID=A0A6I9XTA4_9SAUR|nr:PREDICTED: uncharacterized protein LOC106546851 [Thamnophis sirtalis]
MEKGGFKRLGRLFHHRSESEDSEPDLGKDTPLSSPCPSPCLEGRREHRASCSSTTTTVSGERKKRSAFGHWRLKKKQHQQQSKEEEAAVDPSSLFAPSFDDSEPTTPTNSYFDMPDLQERQQPTQERQQPLIPTQNSQYPYGISVDSISSSTLPASFKKVIKKILLEGAEMLLVAPHWPRRSWFADLVDLSATKCWCIPQEQISLSQRAIQHPDSQWLQLAGRLDKGLALNTLQKQTAALATILSETILHHSADIPGFAAS